MAAQANQFFLFQRKLRIKFSSIIEFYQSFIKIHSDLGNQFYLKQFIFPPNQSYSLLQFHWKYLFLFFRFLIMRNFFPGGGKCSVLHYIVMLKCIASRFAPSTISQSTMVWMTCAVNAFSLTPIDKVICRSGSSGMLTWQSNPTNEFDYKYKPKCIETTPTPSLY